MKKIMEKRFTVPKWMLINQPKSKNTPNVPKFVRPICRKGAKVCDIIEKRLNLVFVVHEFIHLKIRVCYGTSTFYSPVCIIFGVNYYPSNLPLQAPKAT